MGETRPDTPTMLWDGECRFCATWVARWDRWTRGYIRYVPYQRIVDRFPQVTRAQCRNAVQLVDTDGSVYSAAHAVFKAMERGGRSPRPLRLYEQFALMRRITERAYRWVANNRSWLPLW
jgi:predicted DCC family thiol-disulfide oxidoreductase YuxK